MLVVVKAPRIDIRVEGEISKKLLGLLKEEFGNKVKIDEEESVPYRQGEFFKKFGHRANPGNNVKTYRSIANMTQSELGQKLGGMARSHVSEMESGKRTIGKEVAKKLAKIFGVSVELFL